jgi:hypothetical protein
MKTKLMMAVSVLALFAAAPAVAADAGSIDVGMSWGQETTGMKSNFLIGNVSGQLEFGIDDGWNGQVDVFASSSNSGTSTWYGKYTDNTGLSTYGATVHANTTIGDWQLGPFLMLESTTVGDAGYNNGDGAGQNAYLAFGGDVKWNATPDLDLTGQIGGLFNIATPDNAPTTAVLNNAFFANLGGTWFVDDNDAISANVAYLSGEGGSCWYSCGPALSQTGWDYGATFTHQFEDSPFAAYVAYDGNAFAWDGYVQHDNVVTVGVKFFFNGDSMRSQHNTAGFKTPHFERMINQSASADDVSY